MGNLLSEPVVEKETEVGRTSSGLEYGVSSMQGWRLHMEDAHIAQGEIVVRLPRSGGSNKNNSKTPTAAEENAPAKFLAPTEKTCSVTDSSSSSSSSSCADSANGVGCSSMETTTEEDVTNTSGGSDPAEDDFDVVVLRDHSLFAVFDGHGGSFAAMYSARHLVRILSEQEKFREYARLISDDDDSSSGKRSEQEEYARSVKLLSLLEDSLRDTFLKIDEELVTTYQCGVGGPSAPDDDDHMVNEDGTYVGEVDGAGNRIPTSVEESGTTAVVVLFTPTQIICANAGDSRAVYSKTNGRTVPLSYDHKPCDEYEHDRIVSAGGYVSGNRVDGDLAVSRGLGDFRFKANRMVSPVEQKVSALPDVIVQNRNDDEDEFVLVACDGIWDVQTNHEAVDMVHEILGEGETDMGLVCEEVLDLCLHRGSKDNMTALVVKLPGLKKDDNNSTDVGGVSARRRERERLAEESSRQQQAQCRGE